MKVKIDIDKRCTETTITISTAEMNEEIGDLVRQLQDHTPQDDLNFVVGFVDGVARLVDVNKVVRFFASQQKVYAVTDCTTENQEYLIKLRLYELEERLPANQFVRISHSEIVNLKMVKDFDLSFAGSIQVRFINGTATFVSRRYVASIKKTLGL